MQNCAAAVGKLFTQRHQLTCVALPAEANRLSRRPAQPGDCIYKGQTSQWKTLLSQVDIADQRRYQKRRMVPDDTVRSAAYDVGLYAGVAICVVAGLLIFYIFHYPVHQDLAGGALSGRLAVTLGDAFRDYNIYFPPVEKMWFSTAARLSDLTGLRLDLAVVMMTSAIILFGAGLAYQIRRSATGATPLFFILPVAALVIMPILFKNVFGLREHIVAAGLWPYLVLRSSDPDGTLISRRLRVVLGLWMGVTLLFKYLYSVVVALVEIADALLQRKLGALFRIENILAGAVVFLYLFFWLGIDPAQRAVVSAMVSAIDAALVDPVENWAKAARNMFLATVLIVASRSFGVATRETLLALAVTLGAVVAAWTQQRWASHHLFPIMMAYIFWWWTSARQFRWWINAGVALFLLWSVHGQYRATRQNNAELTGLDQMLKRSGLSVAGKRVAILNPHPSPYNEYLVSRGGLRWTPLMNNAYVATEMKRYDKRENIGKIMPPAKLDNVGRRMLHNQMLELWEDMPPDVLILDRKSAWPMRHIAIDWKQAFSKDPRFNAIMKNYRPVLVYKTDEIEFEYYVRKTKE
jgi:hypothetical protein